MTREEKIQKMVDVITTNQEQILFHLQVKKQEVGLKLDVTAAIGEKNTEFLFALETEENDPVQILEDFYNMMEEVEELITQPSDLPSVED